MHVSPHLALVSLGGAEEHSDYPPPHTHLQAVSLTLKNLDSLRVVGVHFDLHPELAQVSPSWAAYLTATVAECDGYFHVSTWARPWCPIVWPNTSLDVCYVFSRWHSF